MKAKFRILLFKFWLCANAVGAQTPLLNNIDPLMIESFYDAVAQGNINQLKELSQKGVPVSIEVKEKKQTPLEIALEKENLEVFKWLVEKGARIYSPRFDAVKQAFIKNNNEIISYLKSKSEVKTNKMPLDIAIKNKNYQLVKSIIKEQKKIDSISEEYRGWLYLEAVRNDDLDIVELLNLKPNELDYHNCDGETALIIAVKQNSNKKVRYLINKGVSRHKPETFDCNGDSSTGNLPHYFAKVNQNKSIYSMLVNYRN